MNLAQIFEIIFYPFRIAIEWFRTFFNSIWGFLLAILSFILIPFNWLADMFIAFQQILIEQLLNAAALVSNIYTNINNALGSLAEPLAIANGLLPLSEVFTCAILLIFLWIAALIYRLIKSYLPTIS